MTAEPDTGKRDLGDLINVGWQKRKSSSTHLARNADANALASNQHAREATSAGSASDMGSPRSALAKRDCDAYTEHDRYTRGVQQQKISETQIYNSSDGCSIRIDTSVTTGRTTSVGAGFNFFDFFEASTDLEFSKQKTRGYSNISSQAPRITGYVTFIPI